MLIPEQEQTTESLEQAATEVVDLGNRLAEVLPHADPWDIADGMLAGAVHYWLYTRQPCEDPMCEDCAPVSSAELRTRELLSLVEKMIIDSDYYQSPNDLTVGRA